MQNDQEKFEQHQLARNALKEIIFMYHEIVNSGGMSAIPADVGCIDEDSFIDCDASNYSIYEEEAEMLHAGVAIKMICDVNHSWDSVGRNLTSSQRIIDIQTMLNNGRLAHMPDLEKALDLGIKDQKELNATHNNLYNKYVAGYFSEMAKTI